MDLMSRIEEIKELEVSKEERDVLVIDMLLENISRIIQDQEKGGGK
jgi:hypothetical protein